MGRREHLQEMVVGCVGWLLAGETGFPQRDSRTLLFFLPLTLASSWMRYGKRSFNKEGGLRLGFNSGG